MATAAGAREGIHSLPARGGYALRPVWAELPIDTCSFEAAFQALAQDGPGVLLESLDLAGMPGPFTIVAGDPAAVVVADSKGARLTEVRRRLPGLAINPGVPVPEALRQLSRELSAEEVPGLSTCSGGLAGMFSYEAAQLIHGQMAPGGRGRPPAPPISLLVLDRVAVYDHLGGRLCLVVHVGAEQPDEDALPVLEEMAGRLSGQPRVGDVPSAPSVSLAAAPNIPAREFLAAVRRGQDHIVEGDIYQVVLSRRLTVPAREPGFTLYRRLRQTNPSPAMFFVRLPGVELAGSSPEPLLKVHHGRALSRPIAGTRPRGRDKEHDRRLAAELLADPKERAEHSMLVDLARNDLGQVCAPGSVRVTEFMAVQNFPRVMHLVSTVEGELQAGRTPVDALFATFPAGTVSGAPKRRAMEIIAAEEPTPRGPYAGAVGYCSFAGELDFCITIRTAVVAGGQVHVQAGAGVVLDSDPARELLETEAKASAILAAVGEPERAAP